LAGVIAGPYLLRLIDGETTHQLSIVNTLALALISLAGGAELRISDLSASFRSLARAMIYQCAIVLVVTTAAFMLASRFLPFMRGFGFAGALGAGLLWGVIAVSRSPSATLAILAQTRPQGPLTRFTLAFVMSSDVVVLVLLAFVMMAARRLLDPTAALSFADLETLGHEIVGSVALGSTLGILLTLYLRTVGSQLLLLLVAMGYGLTEGLHYLRFDPLLTFLISGFVVQNFSKQGAKLLMAIEQTSAIVFVVFFATAGAHLDVPLLKKLWPLALGLSAVRALATWVAHRVSTRDPSIPDNVRRWGASGLVSQAGLTLGISLVIEKNFPTFGAGFRSLAIANVAVNEVIGPIMFKLALDRTKESSAPVLARESVASLAPP
jgi:hypothetical protein